MMSCRLEEKSVPAKEGQKSETRKKLRACLQGGNTEKRYCSCGRATAPATLALYKKKPYNSSPFSCKEGSGCVCVRELLRECRRRRVATEMRRFSRGHVRARTATVVPKAARGDASINSRRHREWSKRRRASRTRATRARRVLVGWPRQVHGMDQAPHQRVGDESSVSAG